MSSIYVKVLGIDADFDEFIVEGDHTVQDLKAMVLTEKTGRLVGLKPSDLKVYNGDSDNVSSLAVERIQSKLSSYEDTSFVVVPVTGPLSTITKVSGKLPSAILSQSKPETIEPQPEFKLIPFLSPDSKIRQMIERPIEINTTTRAPEVVVPDAIFHPDPNYRSRFGASVSSNISNFIPESVVKPEPVEHKMTGNSLSDASPVKRLLDIPTGVFLNIPDAVVEVPYDLVLPEHGQTIKTILDTTAWNGNTLPGFDRQPVPEIHIRDMAMEHGTSVITNALDRIKQIPLNQIVRGDVQVIRDDPYVWIALGTMSSDETFHPHMPEHVESFCSKNLRCFESTKKHKLLRFFIDIDGFTPYEFSRQQFNEVDATVTRTLHTLFNKTSAILTSSCYRHTSQRVGPLGTNLPKTKNKLSYRLVFNKIYGTLEAMDYWLMREILPKLKAELSGICTVTEQEETEKIQVPDKIPVIILDRWNYYGGDRMRMMGSSKEYENRPLVPVGDVSFMDTVIAFIPSGSVRLPERTQSNSATRVPIWEPL